MYRILKATHFWMCAIALVGTISVVSGGDKVKLKKNGDVTITGDVDTKKVVVSHDHLTIEGDPGDAKYVCRMGGTATGPHGENLCR